MIDFDTFGVIPNYDFDVAPYVDTNLYVFGKRDSGKTKFLHCLATHLLEKGYVGYLLSVDGLINMLNNRDYKATQEHELLDYFYKCNFIFLDGIGQENSVKGLNSFLRRIPVFAIAGRLKLDIVIDRYDDLTMLDSLHKSNNLKVIRMKEDSE